MLHYYSQSKLDVGDFMHSLYIMHHDLKLLIFTESQSPGFCKKSQRCREQAREMKRDGGMYFLAAEGAHFQQP